MILALGLSPLPLLPFLLHLVQPLFSQERLHDPRLQALTNTRPRHRWPVLKYHVLRHVGLRNLHPCHPIMLVRLGATTDCIILGCHAGG